MGIKKQMKKIIFGAKADADTYIEHLRSIGVRIGERTMIYEPRFTLIDETRPCLLEIGNDVKITRGVTILTHGYDWSVLAGLHNVVLGSAGKVTIGDNVFIGMNTTILKGVTVGKNVIIGAGSLVNKDIPDNCVAAGNPARVIMSIDDYYESRKKAQLGEALVLYENYVKAFGKEPPIEVFDEFSFLFMRKEDELPENFKRQMSHHGTFKETYENLISNAPMFDGFEEFLKYANKNTK